MRQQVSWLVLATHSLTLGALQAAASPAAAATVVVTPGIGHARPVPGPVWGGPRWGVRPPVRPGCMQPGGALRPRGRGLY